MKKYIIVLLLISSIFCRAQQGFHIGAVLGLNTTWISHQDDYGQLGVEHVLDYGVAPAITLGYNFNNFIGLQMDFIYSLQGGKYQETLKDSTLTRQVKLNYFKIPLYFKYAYTPKDNQKVKFFIMAGPEAAILSSAVITSDYLFVPYVGSDEKYRFETFDLELAGQTGADIYATNNLYINLGLRADYGLLDMNAAGYRQGDLKGIYAPANNFTAGLIVGINYTFAKK